jgi:hypothetical protein
MILMWMGKDNGIQLADIATQHLVAEIGGRVDDDGRTGRLNEDAGT